AIRDRQTAAEASREEARRDAHATAQSQIEEGVYVGARPLGVGTADPYHLSAVRKGLVPMDHPGNQTGFVYTNYIKATPDRIWQGLTDPTLTKRYWRHPAAGGKTLPSDWKKGSTWDLVHEDVG